MRARLRRHWGREWGRYLLFGCAIAGSLGVEWYIAMR